MIYKATMENGSYLQYNSSELLKTRMRRRWCEEGGQMVAFLRWEQ